MLEQGGIQPGGLNFDAKVRRESSEVKDMFIAHIGKIHVYELTKHMQLAFYDRPNLSKRISNDLRIVTDRPHCNAPKPNKAGHYNDLI